MTHLNQKAKLLGIALATLLAVLASSPVVARDNPSDHPIRILKARVQNDQARGGNSARGNLTIWMQNSANVTVDGIEVEVELYNNRKRKVETLRRKVDSLDSGEKKVVTFRWDVVAEDDVTPRFFVEYNSRGTQKTRFEGETPSWN